MRLRVPAGILLAVAVGAAPPPAAGAGGDSPSKLLKAWFKARKDEDRDAARRAIEEAPPLDPGEVEDLRDGILEALARAGRRVPPKGRNEWFDGKEMKAKEMGPGLFYASFRGKKGLVLGLHGGGAGAGDAGSAQSSFAGPVGSLGMSALFPEVLRKTEYGWTDPPDTERWVMDLVKRARVSWGIDPNRVYVTGHSMGGYGTWTYGSLYADLFAGGAAFAGAPTVYWKEGMKDKEATGVADGYLPNLYNLPLFVYQSLDDRNVPCAANVFACGRLKDLHAEDPDGWEFVYEEVDGRGHGFPAKGPGPGLEWMASHERDPRPRRIRWQPMREWKTTFYWMRWERPWRGCVLVATRDPERNAVDVTVAAPYGVGADAATRELEDRAGALSVYVDDRVLDPAREIVITLDGKVRYRGRPEPRLGVLLRSCEEREDPEYAFAREARLGPVLEETVSGGK